MARTTTVTLGRSTLISGVCLLCLALPAGAEPEAPSPAAATESSAPIAVTLSSPPPSANGDLPTLPVAADTLREPRGFDDIESWMRYREEAQLASLPVEARIFYRRAVQLRASGRRDEAMQLLQGAVALDPGFWMPPITLAVWQLASEPGSILASVASVFDFAKEHVALALTVQANLIFVLIQALLLGLIAAGFITVLLHSAEIRHRLSELMVPRVPRPRARVYAWAVAALPWMLGFGIVLPTLFALAFLWASLKLRERVVFVLLAACFVALPAANHLFGRLATPMSETEPPFHGVLAVPDEPATPERTARLEDLAARYPQNGFIQFARAWSARQTGDLATAEAAYRRTLQIWPGDDRALNNLGNVLDIQGREEEALAAYREAAESNPRNGAPHYNEARIHAERFDFEAATRSMNRAGELDFDLMKPYRSGHSSDQRLPTADQWISPTKLRAALAEHRGPSHAAVPPAWRQRIEATGFLFSIAVLLILGGGIALGIAARRNLAVSTCANCGITICRRCATRRRERGFCRECGAADARSTDSDHARRALYERQVVVTGRLRRIRMVLATVIPGFGLLSHRRMFAGLIVLMVVTTLAVSGWTDLAPFAYEPRVPAPDLRITPGLAPWLQLLPWVLVLAVSCVGFLLEPDRESRAQEPPVSVRRRPVTPSPALDADAA